MNTTKVFSFLCQWLNILDCVLKYLYYICIIVCGIFLMPRLEVEYFTVAASVTTARAEYLAALIASYKYKLIGLGYAEGLGIGFLVVELYVTVNSLRYLVGGVADPNIFAVAVLSPAKRAGRTHKQFKRL